MNAEFCNHFLRKTNDEFLLQCNCGSNSQLMCCECSRRIDATNSYKCCECERRICNTCVLDCTRRFCNARCERCAASKVRTFEAKLWCLVIRIFFVDNLNTVRVENHIAKTLFRSTNDAISAIPTLLRALHPTSELVDQLIKSTAFAVVPETQNKEVLQSTDTIFLKGFSVRVEYQLKSMINDAEETVLPSQMKG